jgi:flagellar biosynthesis regulator FlaF
VALAQAGHSYEAREAAQAIENASRRAEVLRDVASALAQAGREEEAKRSFIEAQEAAQAIENPDKRAEALQAVALALAQAGYFQEVLRASEDLNYHIKVLACLVPSLERLESGLSVELFSQVVRIAGWVLPSWRSMSLGSKDG